MARGIGLALVAALALGGCVEQVKRDRIEDALVYAGVAEPTAGCMAHRMAQKLTIRQLERMRSLEGARNWLEYIDAVGRLHDPDAVEVTASSYVMCRSGMIQ